MAPPDTRSAELEERIIRQSVVQLAELAVRA
jgi:hypothetical protein